MGVKLPYAPQAWVDLVTDADAAHMNTLEAGVASSVQKPTGLLDGEGVVWDNAAGGWERSSVKKLARGSLDFGAGLVNADVAAAAAIAQSKLALAITNAEVAAGAAIAKSKLAALGIVDADVTGPIAASKISGLPTVYRKNTTKTVVNSVNPTDLLNGEITIGAGVMGANSFLRCRFWGTHKQATGATAGAPQFLVVLGGTTLFDTNTLPGSETTNANVWGWDMTLDFFNLGATNSQAVRMLLNLDQQWAASVAALFVTGQGLYINGASYGGYSQAVAKGYNTSAIDMTVARLLELRVVNAAISANYDTILKGALVEVI